MALKDSKVSTAEFILYPLALVPIVFFPFIIDAFNTPKVWILFALSIGVLVHKLLSKNINVAFLPLQKKALFGIAVLLIGIVLTSILSETTFARLLWGYPGRGNGLIYFVSIYTLLIIALSLSFDLKFESRLSFALHVPMTINIVYASFQIIGEDPIGWQNPYNPIIGTFGNPNFSGAFLGVTSSYFFYLATVKENPIRVSYGLLALYSLFLSYSTDSIQGPIVSIVGIFLIALRLLQLNRPKKHFMGLLSLALSTSLFLFLSFLGLGPLGSTLEQYTLILRFQYWLIALKSAWAHPWTGLGPDSYFEGFLKHRTSDFVETYSVGLRADAAHSAPLNFLASFGFVNFILYIMLVSAISLAAYRVWTNRELQKRSISSLPLIWFLLLIQSFFSLEQIGLGVFQWISGAICLGFYFDLKRSSEMKLLAVGKQKSPRVNVTKGKTLGLKEFRGEIAWASVFVALFFSVTPIKEEMFLKNLSRVNLQNSESRMLAEEKISKLSFVSTQEYKRAMWISDFFLNSNNVLRASEVVEEIIEVDPQAYDALSQLARIRNFQGLFLEESNIREKIFVLNPLDFSNMLGIAVAQENLGNKVQAKKWASRVLELAPETPEFDSATMILSGEDK